MFICTKAAFNWKFNFFLAKSHEHKFSQWRTHAFIGAGVLFWYLQSQQTRHFRTIESSFIGCCHCGKARINSGPTLENRKMLYFMVWFSFYLNGDFFLPKQLEISLEPKYLESNWVEYSTNLERGPFNYYPRLQCSSTLLEITRISCIYSFFNYSFLIVTNSRGSKMNCVIPRKYLNWLQHTQKINLVQVVFYFRV